MPRGRKNAAAASASCRFRSARSSDRPVQCASSTGRPAFAIEPLQRDHEQEDVVDFAEERNEVGDEVERHHDVRDRAGDEQLVDRGDAPIGEQSAEEPEVARAAA